MYVALTGPLSYTGVCLLKNSQQRLGPKCGGYKPLSKSLKGERKVYIRGGAPDVGHV